MAIGGASRIQIGERGPILVDPGVAPPSFAANASPIDGAGVSAFSVAAEAELPPENAVAIGSHFCGRGATAPELAMACVRSKAISHGRPIEEPEMGFQAHRKRSLERGVYVEPVGVPDAGQT